MSDSALDLFSPAVRAWFAGTFDGPTAVQNQAWASIAEGRHTLVVAPTGSGKTLAAFLFAIDRLMAARKAAAEAGEKWQPGVRVLYVSPLKALGADVNRNLSAPLQGILEQMAACKSGTVLKLHSGTSPKESSGASAECNFRTVPDLQAAGASEALAVTVGMRTGDTPPDERRKLQRKPPDILITTPESLYLMLTSQARSILSTVKTAIIDEIHAMAGSKRGAHLSLSLERLEELTEKPFQRIGLSATVEPLDAVAHFLGGAGRPVNVVADEAPAAFDLQVRVPVPDMTAIPAASGRDMPAAKPAKPDPTTAWKSDRAMRAFLRNEQAAAQAALPPDTGADSGSIWPHIEAAILDEVLAHRSTIVFVNSRGLCERLTARLNELHAKRCGAADAAIAAAAGDGASASFRSSMGASSALVSEPAPDLVIAKAHHGSVSKEKRLAVEAELKRGKLPCVVATSSLELGIDMGEVDLVLQVAPPLSVSSGLQRVGRANHQVGGKSCGIMFPRTRTEVLDCAVMAEGMRQRKIERTELVSNALDVLAQQTTAAVAMEPEGLASEAWLACVRRSACYEDLPEAAFRAVLMMLAGRYGAGDAADFAPRITLDGETGLMTPLPRTQRLAVTGAGTIPDRGLFPVMLAREGQGTAVPGKPNPGGADAPRGRKQGRRRVGELDEEMVAESRVGDVIILGTSTWRITEIGDDRVLVEPAPGRSARLPFWHGEGVGRPLDAGMRKGAFAREAAEALEGDEESGRAPRAFAPAMQERLAEAGLDGNAAANLAALLAEQRQATGAVPSDAVLVLEQCADEAGGWSLILHSPFGRRVHEPWALAISERASRELGYDLQAAAGDDGIVMHIPLAESAFPSPDLFRFDPDEIEAIVRGAVGRTALFATRFRECAARALLMTPTMPGKRAPLWQQRLRGGQLLEAAREMGDFPLLAEAARECLQEVYDLTGLRDVMERLERGEIELREARTPLPSPFAVPLLFGYMADHLYEGDLPHAERQASLLAVDSALLGELVGGGDVTELLDDDVMAAVEAELQWLAEERRAHDGEGVAEMLRKLGPLTAEEVAARLDAEEPAEALLAELEAARRAFPFELGGKARWAAAADGPRLRDVLGAEAPAWALIEMPVDKVPGIMSTPGSALPGNGEVNPGVDIIPGTLSTSGSESMIDGLMVRFARSHGAFTVADAARGTGLGKALAAEAVARLRSRGELAQGAFTETVRSAHYLGEGERLWISVEVLRRMRLRSLAKAREAMKPVSAAAYVRFLFARQSIAALEGIDGVAEAIAQFEGVALPRAAWEGTFLRARVADYSPAMLDELLGAGEIIWVGDGAGDPDALLFFPTDSPFAPFPVQVGGELAETLVDEPGDAESGRPSVRQAIAEALAEESGLAFPTLAERVRRLRDGAETDATTDAMVAAELLALSREGRAAVDSFALPRSAAFDPDKLNAASPAAGEAAAPRHASSRRGRSRYRSMQADARRTARASTIARGNAYGALAGRWSLVAAPDENDTVRALAVVESLFDRYGLITPELAAAYGVKGGMSVLYPVLRSLEDAGEVLRGTFVEGLGNLQFAPSETVEELRAEGAADDSPVVLAADDPAQLYGAVLPWPASAEKPARRTGALVVFCGGEPVLWATPNLKALIAFTDDQHAIDQALSALVPHALADLNREGGRKRLLIETLNGQPVLDTPSAATLLGLGAVRDATGLKLYASPF